MRVSRICTIYPRTLNKNFNLWISSIILNEKSSKMDTEDTSLETKCENLMNIVVESRKRFGKMSVDYEQKTTLMENKILNLQIETFTKYKIKPKNTLPEVLDDDSKDLEDFSVEIVDMARRFDELRKKLKCTQEVVTQLKADSVGRRLREPLTRDVLLAKAKGKNLA